MIPMTEVSEMRYLVHQAVESLKKLQGTKLEWNIRERARILYSLILSMSPAFKKETDHLKFVLQQELRSPDSERDLDHLVHVVSRTADLREVYWAD